MDKIGFIILRHVNSEITNKYWIVCYDHIRKYYPDNSIIIIDDNSNYEYITDKKLYKTTIINGRYPGRGELLPYYYYLNNKLFETAVIIHDSVFINKYIDFNDIDIEKYKLLWHFEHDWDQEEDESRMISSFNDKELLDFYNDKNLWKGCFGGMSIIKHDYLAYVNSKFDISKLLNYVLTRYNRMSFERVIACLLCFCDDNGDNNNKNNKNEENRSLFGDINKYYKKVGIKFDDVENFRHLPMIKVWTGR